MDGISRLGWAAVFSDISDRFRVEPVRRFKFADHRGVCRATETL